MITGMDIGDLPSFDNIVSDAIAMGYQVVAYIIDQEKGETYRVNSKEINHEKWLKALEKVHGGPMTSESKIYAEEIKHNVRDELVYSTMSNQDLNSWIQHYEQEILACEEGDPYIHVYEEQIELATDEMKSRHDTWFNPGDEPLPQDSACYCGWLGREQPLPEFKPPDCNCVIVESEVATVQWKKKVD